MLSRLGQRIIAQHGLQIKSTNGICVLLQSSHLYQYPYQDSLFGLHSSRISIKLPCLFPFALSNAMPLKFCLECLVKRIVYIWLLFYTLVG